MRILIAFGIFFTLFTIPVFSGEPMSAIDWISKSSRLDIIKPIENDMSKKNQDDIESVLISDLGVTSLNSIGIVSAGDLEIPREIWEDSNEDTLVGLLSNFPYINFLEGKIFLRKLLIMEASPPKSTNEKNKFLVERLRNLLELGALEEVDIILKLANPNSDSLLKLWEANAFLSARTDDFCDKILSNTNIETSIEVKVICLASENEWDAANFVLNSASVLNKLDTIMQDLLTLYLEPEFETSANLSETGKLTPVSSYLREFSSIEFSKENLSIKYFFQDLNNKYDIKKRFRAKIKYVEAGMIPFSQILDELDKARSTYDLQYNSNHEGFSQGSRSKTSNQLKDLQKYILRLSYTYEEPNIFIPFLKYFAEDIEKIHQINPIRSMEELVKLSYLVSDTWLPPTTIKVSKNNDLTFAKMIKMRQLSSKLIEEKQGCDNFCLAICRVLIQKKNEKYRFRNPQKNVRSGEKLLQGLSLLSPGSTATPENISKGLKLMIEAGQRKAAEKFSIELLIRRYLKKKSEENKKVRAMITSLKNHKHELYLATASETSSPIDVTIKNLSKKLQVKINSLNLGGRNFKVSGKIRPDKLSLELEHAF